MTQIDAENRLRERIEEGQTLLKLTIRDSTKLEEAKIEQKKWSDYNAELLRRMVDTDELVNAYYPIYAGFIGGRTPPLHAQVKEFYDDVSDKITRLESILGRLELIPEASHVTSTIHQAQSGMQGEFHTIYIHRTNLIQEVDNLYSLEELEDLCHGLGIDIDNLAGNTKKRKFIRLIQIFERRGELLRLIFKIHQERPNLSWERLTTRGF